MNEIIIKGNNLMNGLYELTEAQFEDDNFKDFIK